MESNEKINELDLVSMKSSLLNDELLAIKRKNETKAYIIYIFVQIIWAINGIQLKTIHRFFPDYYTNNSFIFYRNIAVTILSYFLCKKRNIRIRKPSEVKEQFWFYCRNIGIYVCIVTWMESLLYFRLSTCQIMSGLSPILIIFFSIVLVGEKFYIRYLYGVIICFIGSCIIILNERKPNLSEEKFKDNMLLGMFILGTNIVLFALGNIGQKKLCSEHISSEEQNFYFGLYSLIFSGIYCLFTFYFGIRNILYGLYSASNGIVFFLGNYYTSESYKLIPISKVTPIFYLNIVIIFFLGAYLFNEKIFFSDIVGAIMIIGFITYNGVYPPYSTKR